MGANEVSWSSLLAACGAAAEWQRALLLLQQSDLSPVAIGATLAACANGEAWCLVARRLEESGHAYVIHISIQSIHIYIYSMLSVFESDTKSPKRAFGARGFCSEAGGGLLAGAS